MLTCCIGTRSASDGRCYFSPAFDRPALPLGVRIGEALGAVMRAKAEAIKPLPANYRPV